MNITPPITVSQGAILSSSATKQFGIGQIGYDKTGRRYRYVLNGAVAMVPGKTYQSAAPVAFHQATTAAAAAIGDASIVGTLGATAATLNQYAGGHASIYVTPGQGYGYGIKSHAAVLASGDLTAVLDDGETVAVALTTASKITFMAHPYSSVVVCPATLTAPPIGVAVWAVEAAYFGWVQDGGICTVLIDGTPAVGQDVACSSAVIGAAAIQSGTLPTIGRMCVVGVDTKYQPVLLTGF